MISRSAKAAFYAIARIPMAVSGAAYRAFSAPRSGTVRVQLGPGRGNHLDGWINVDANAFGKRRPEVWADLRNPLPFPDATVDAIYSHHVIEHLPDSFLAEHFREMSRVLKPGGMIRVGGPDAEEAARQMLAGNGAWFSDFPDKRRSIGGKFANFLLCRGEHTAILTESYLRELAEEAGLVGVTVRRPCTDTGSPDLFGDALAIERESTPDAPHTLMIEAVKR